MLKIDSLFLVSARENWEQLNDLESTLTNEHKGQLVTFLDSWYNGSPSKTIAKDRTGIVDSVSVYQGQVYVSVKVHRIDGNGFLEDTVSAPIALFQIVDPNEDNEGHLVMCPTCARVRRHGNDSFGVHNDTCYTCRKDTK